MLIKRSFLPQYIYIFASNLISGTIKSKIVAVGCPSAHGTILFTSKLRSNFTYSYSFLFDSDTMKVMATALIGQLQRPISLLTRLRNDWNDQDPDPDECSGHLRHQKPSTLKHELKEVQEVLLC